MCEWLTRWCKMLGRLAFQCFCFSLVLVGLGNSIVGNIAHTIPCTTHKMYILCINTDKRNYGVTVIKYFNECFEIHFRCGKMTTTTAPLMMLFGWCSRTTPFVVQLKSSKWDFKSGILSSYSLFHSGLLELFYLNVSSFSLCLKNEDAFQKYYSWRVYIYLRVQLKSQWIEMNVCARRKILLELLGLLGRGECVICI